MTIDQQTPAEALVTIEHCRRVRLAGRRITRDASILGIVTHADQIKSAVETAERLDSESRLELIYSAVSRCRTPAQAVHVISRLASLKTPSAVRLTAELCGIVQPE